MSEARYSGDVVEAVIWERVSQIGKWGEPNHHPLAWIALIAEELGEASECAVQASVEPVTITGADAQQKMRQMRDELIQVAAVAVAAIESLDRNELAAAQTKGAE